MLFVLPIGGADMPVVISLLNAFTGLAAAATGFELENNVLIVSGMLVGASGTLLTMMMGQAMNRSIANVLFGAFGQVQRRAAATAAGGTGRGAPDHRGRRGVMLAYAQKVVIVPGYGMAVAQAQHDVRELADLLEASGVEVTYAIHPVAGRMPGHMNVLLAEANVPYTALKEMDEANAEFPQTDVSLVIGANDVVNPAARNNPSSPIYGMPILNVDEAKQDRAQALDGARLRRHRQPALPRPEDGDAVRRREGVGREARSRASRRCDARRPGLRRAATSSRRSHRSAQSRRCAHAFVAHCRGEWTMPPKVYVTNYPAGDFRAMPALGARARAAQVGDVVSRATRARGLPTVTASCCSRTRRTGSCGRCSTQAPVTALRTGAAAVLAAETLGRADAATAAVVGAGVNGRAAARTFLARGRQVLLWDVERGARTTGRRASSAPTLRRRSRRRSAADLLVTVTPGHEVLLADGSLRPGQHVRLMGADGPGKAEAADAELARARLFCDDWEQASHGGELAHAVEAGLAGARAT